MNGRLKLFAALLILSLGPACGGADNPSYDIVVYGGNAGGVMAAVQASRMGKSVVLVHPTKHVGGLTTGGLGATDIGNKTAIGGLAREFYERIAEHYADDSAWRQQKRSDYKSNRQEDADTAAMWTFEPHVAEEILSRFIREADVPVLFEERLDRGDGVSKKGAKIVSIRTESGRVFKGRMFIDASYEGDLMAAAGVSYHIGREAVTDYDESLNGVQTANARFHQFHQPVSPYRVKDNPASGLLPGIDPDGPGREGSGDKRVQAYNFRLCLTDAPDNQVTFEKPESFDPLRYEPLFRYYEAGYDAIPWINTPMPNRKTDINNRHGFSSDFIGQNYGYPEADYETRERMIQEHRDYQMGLMWCLANHPRVPTQVRREVSRWGLAADEFVDNGHWPHQIYVREARRMIGSYLMTQNNCQGKQVAPDPVGLAAYTMDSHNIQRYVDPEGNLKNEGDVQVGGFPPYPIAFRALLPQEDECVNLLVPVCLSATHIAFGSIRMEPVFMVLGQSAVTAACAAIDEGKNIQRIDTDRLRQKLLADGQVLQWKGGGD